MSQQTNDINLELGQWAGSILSEKNAQNYSGNFFLERGKQSTVDISDFAPPSPPSPLLLKSDSSSPQSVGGGGDVLDLPTITVDLCINGQPAQATIYGELI